MAVVDRLLHEVLIDRVHLVFEHRRATLLVILHLLLRPAQSSRKELVLGPAILILLDRRNVMVQLGETVVASVAALRVQNPAASILLLPNRYGLITAQVNV